jgi:hypothetical protein
MVDTYDAGLLNGLGGGDVDWWHDYIRAELARAHDFYTERTPPTISEAAVDAAARAHYTFANGPGLWEGIT